MDDMLAAQRILEKAGHKTYMPVKAKGVDYWSKNNSTRVMAKKNLNLIGRHLDHIDKSDAILVVNMTKGKKKNYIGANTFLEIGFANYRKKKIYFLNPIPGQSYILDEIQTAEPIVLQGNLSLIS